MKTLQFEHTHTRIHKNTRTQAHTSRRWSTHARVENCKYRNNICSVLSSVSVSPPLIFGCDEEEQTQQQQRQKHNIIYYLFLDLRFIMLAAFDTNESIHEFNQQSKCILFLNISFRRMTRIRLDWLQKPAPVPRGDTLWVNCKRFDHFVVFTDIVCVIIIILIIGTSRYHHLRQSLNPISTTESAHPQTILDFVLVWSTKTSRIQNHFRVVAVAHANWDSHRQQNTLLSQCSFETGLSLWHLLVHDLYVCDMICVGENFCVWKLPTMSEANASCRHPS